MALSDKVAAMRIVRSIWTSEVPLVLAYSALLSLILTWWAHAPA